MLRKLTFQHEPVRKLFERESPDFFACIETKCSSTNKLPSLENYFSIASPALRTGGVPSGGICIYVKNQFKFNTSKVPNRQNKNILWVQLQNKHSLQKLSIGFAYCRPGPPEETTRFYNCLSQDISKFSKVGDVAVFGDLNSRLGSILGDKSRNSSACYLENLVEFHNLTILNKRFAFGIPTYCFSHENGNRTSIIDI